MSAARVRLPSPRVKLLSILHDQPFGLLLYTLLRPTFDKRIDAARRDNNVNPNHLFGFSAY